MSERWSLISRIYHEASAQPVEARERFVRQASAGDSDVERHVRSLLANSADDSFLQRVPVVDLPQSDSPPVRTGRLGPFELRGLLGAGGMGEVYRAHDAALGRDVAIKILPPQFVDDRDRMARFEREARVLATLNHPNIAAIYGVDAIPPDPGVAGSGLRAMVLELVEGQTLAERIERGPLAIPEALDIARQLVDALDAAHEKGIVHRDLKPANIKIRPDGVVKVLDFGLSKAFDVEASPADERRAPAAGHTVEGVVLGTPAYMSPEQARGYVVDKRTDVWAFGCVLYEMLTGVAAFQGATASDTISAVLTRDPDLSALPRATPPGVHRTVERCLAKDARRRLRDIADAGPDLEERPAPSPGSPPPVASRRTAAAAIVTAVLVVATAWLAVERFSRANVDLLPQGGVLERLTYYSGLTTTPAISPDGQLVAYASDRAGGGDLDIWVQQAGGGPPLRLTTDPADDHWPEFSPDGKQIVFRSERGGGGTYLVPALGGSERLVVEGGRNARFSPDGSQLAYWTGQFRGPASTHTSALFTVPLSGGTPRRIAGEFDVARDPLWAPDGGSLLFLGRSDRDRPVADTFDWWWVPLDGRTPVKTGMFESGLLKDSIAFLGDGSPAAWTAEGVLFTAAANLWIVPLSSGNGRLTGPPTRLTTVTGRAEAPSIGRDGSIVFAVSQSQRVIERASLDPQAVDPKPLPVYADNRDVALRASTSADGVTMVFDQGFEKYREIWVRDTRTGRQYLLLRVMAAYPGSPTISADGARVAYRVVDSSGAEDRSQSFVVEVAGGVPKPLCDRCGVYGFLSDDYRVLVTWDDERVIGTIDVRTGSRVELVRPNGGRLNRPHASPDDRWLAFRHTVDSVSQIYVVPFPVGRISPPTEWQLVDEPTTTGRPAGWSLDSTILYTLLDTDGFRCIWGQRVDRHTGRLVGSVFPARHLHMPIDNGPSTSFSNPITADGLLYERVSATGDLWRLSRPATDND
jgi:serine/threonine protein kinase/Tol biopolymer transport system component